MPEEKKTEQERFLKKKLYDVTFTLDPQDVPEEVTSAALVGEFLFYRSNLQGHTDKKGMVEHDEKFPPARYQPGMSQIGGRYCQPMDRDPVTGVFTTSLTLPAGAYLYGFQLNPRFTPPATDESLAWQNLTLADGSLAGLAEPVPPIPDPRRLPSAPTKDGPQGWSRLCVGTPEDCPWLPAADPAVKGTVTYLTYRDICGDDRTLGVYLPAGYDRTREYPLICVSHGGGGNEADWFCQGGLADLMDNLIAGRKTQPAVVVTMNNSVYDWEFALIDQNLLQCILPLVHRLFAVSDDPDRMAFCGLSMGSITTLYTYMHHPERFHYFGAFSGGFCGGEGFTLDNPHLHQVKLLIGCAEEDIAYNERDIGVPPTIRALKEAGIPYIPYFVPGSHDWFCWPEMFRHFAETVLWS